MLTDIFAYRYLKYPIWSAYSESERRLLNQTVTLAKDVFPYYNAEGKKIDANEAKWKLIHDRLARELGINELAQRYYSYTQKGPAGQDWPVSGFFGWDYACEQFVNAQPPPNLVSPDAFVKERLSFIELAMRIREEEVAQANTRFPNTLLEAKLHDGSPTKGLRLPGSAIDGVKAWNASLNESPRVLRRLQILREWSDEQNKQIFPRSKRTSSPPGARASQ
ncbi:hypothetical protein [Nitrosomonas sp. Is79A3]|uniref:AbiJ-NTD4 domain-containing protein n=1 Tax=Nitrosomonas sp. (strain Is79A3) TaxID=261292 RepID=UPI0002FE05BE